MAAAGATEPPSSADIHAILKNSAEYCRRLGAATFRFICQETVKETVRDQKGKKTSKSYLYDYQITGEKGKALETRTLMKVDGRSVPRRKNARLETGFYSHVSVYAPVLLLGQENQGGYHYRVVKSDRLGGRKAWVLEVEPLAEHGVILHGRVWVDQRDFSVLCIEVNPAAMGGHEKQQENARKMGAELQMSDTHWYGFSRNGLRFPSRTEFREEYRFADYPPGTRLDLRDPTFIAPVRGWTWKRSETSFTYGQYQFFQVQVEYQAYPLRK
ncbi:MAG: hypothetical protein PHX05_07445 [Acidobacteriota bacterium]|nr:hypothetical protein [Acidobacteriota bacterium]